MDVFKTLAGGGIRFDKKRFANDMAVFNPRTSSSMDESNQKAVLPKELDFFGDAQADQPFGNDSLKDKKGAANGIAGMNSLLEATPVQKESLSAFLKQHKIKLSGTDAPLPMTSWQELTSRWQVDTRLMRNLAKFGWQVPTDVQKAAIPPLLDVRTSS